jgi:hypothetical protein
LTPLPPSPTCKHCVPPRAAGHLREPPRNVSIKTQFGRLARKVAQPVALTIARHRHGVGLNRGGQRRDPRQHLWRKGTEAGGERHSARILRGRGIPDGALVGHAMLPHRREQRDVLLGDRPQCRGELVRRAVHGVGAMVEVGGQPPVLDAVPPPVTAPPGLLDALRQYSHHLPQSVAIVRRDARRLGELGVPGTGPLGQVAGALGGRTGRPLLCPLQLQTASATRRSRSASSASGAPTGLVLGRKKERMASPRS